MPGLKIRDVYKTFGSNIEVLKGVNLEVEQGQFLILVGNSGCGKSTLLNMIAGLETITRGEIEIGGRVVNDLPPKSRDIAMVFQSYALYPSMTVKENIAFGLEIRKVPLAERSTIVARVAEMLQISDLLDRSAASSPLTSDANVPTATLEMLAAAIRGIESHYVWIGNLSLEIGNAFLHESIDSFTVIADGKAERVHFVFIDEAGGKRRHHGHPHRRLHGFQRDGAIARQFAAKRAGLFEQRLLIGEGPGVTAFSFFGRFNTTSATAPFI